jgi:hypothetical protein
MHQPREEPSPRRSSRPSGTPLVVGLLVLGAALAAFALGFQRWQTNRCLAFFGGGVARAITAAPVVELWQLSPGSGPGRLAAARRCDVSTAPGIVHLRRGLVEDANFAWQPRDGARLSADAWKVAIAFRPAPDAAPAAVLVLGVGPTGGEMGVVGRPGRIGLGRIEKGLRTWIGTACPGLPFPGRE